MSATDDAQATTRTLSVVRLLAGSQAQPRVAMRGTSMTPLLREPMVLTLGPSGASDKVGDILVFERGGELIAHRITRIRDDLVQTCGDAVPWSPEQPGRAAIVGKVVAVLADDADGAPRVDTRMFRLRGLYKARFRAVRALPFRLCVLGRRIAYALPWMRKRPFVALVQAMAAKLRDDAKALERAIAMSDPSALAAVARRHGCSAMLVEAVSALHVHGDGALSLQRMLQPVGRSVALRGMATKAQLVSVVRVLTGARVTFALLKGAARLYRDDPDATLHGSADLDVLVPAAQLDAGIAALRAQGYSERADDERQRKYRDHHHHAAPLFPPEPGCAVELHVTLAPPGTLSIPLDWDALAGHLVAADGPAGRVYTLDDSGTALHYAVHALGLRRLRDVVLLAAIIARLGPGQRRDLREAIAAEQIDRVRLSSGVLLAARLAGVGWPADGAQEEYLRWVMRREDMPLFLGTRSQLAEGYFGADRRITPLGFRLLDPRSRLGAPTDKRKPTLFAAAGRIATSVCAFCYASMMRPAT
jgi:hypothetical protein